MVWTSKRFWMAVAGVIGVVLTQYTPITQAQVNDIVMLIAAWIIGDSFRATTDKGNNRRF
jgi:hypothetical protein